MCEYKLLGIHINKNSDSSFGIPFSLATVEIVLFIFFLFVNFPAEPKFPDASLVRS